MADVYYRPELDALRFFAFLSVFVCHRMDFLGTDPVHDVWRFRIGTAGAFGVPVFFLLSAFLITELLLRERERTGRVHVGAFYVRRILRIWPLYFFVFFGLAALDHVMPGVGTRDPHAWLAFTFFSGNWWIVFHGWVASPVNPVWSISVEEQFYLLIPAIMAWGGKRALAWVSGIALCLSYGTVLWYALHPVQGDNREWPNSLVHFQFFAAGCLLALALHGRTWTAPGAARLLMAGMGVGGWFVAELVFGVRCWDAHPSMAGAVLGWGSVLVSAILLFLAVMGVRADAVPRGLARLGRISYGLYMYHSLMFFLIFERFFPVRAAQDSIWGVWVRTGLVFLLTVGAAAVSFRFFERPILRLKRRWTFVPAREEAKAAP